MPNHTPRSPPLPGQTSFPRHNDDVGIRSFWAIHVTGGVRVRRSSTAGSLGDAPGSVDVRESVVAFVVFSMAAWWR